MKTMIWTIHRFKQVYRRRYEKAPLAEAQTAFCIWKTRNTFCGTRVSVPLAKFCEKLLPHPKFNWNRSIGCWVTAKNYFQYGKQPPFWILEIFIFGHVTVIEFQICCCVPNLIKTGWFLLRWGRFDNFENGGCLPS